MSPPLKLCPCVLALRGSNGLIALLEPPRHLRALSNKQTEKNLARLFRVGVVDHDAAAEARALRDRGDQLDLVVRRRVELQDGARRVAEGCVQGREEACEAVRGGRGRM